MSHLSRDERLLALDGALDATRQAHLASCPACRTDVETLGGVLARVRAVDVPEPSPLFWDHLAARVGDAIAREPAPVPDRGWWSPRLAWAAAAVVITAAGAGYLARPQPQPAGTVVGRSTPAVADPIEHAPVDERRRPVRLGRRRRLGAHRGGRRPGRWTTRPSRRRSGRPSCRSRRCPPTSAGRWRASWPPNWRRAGTGKDDRDHVGQDVQARRGARRRGSRRRARRGRPAPARNRGAFGSRPPCRPPDRAPGQAANENVDPAELGRLFDAYTVMQAQEALGLDEARFGPFVTRLRALQEMRRRHLRERAAVMRDLRQLLQAPGNDAQLKERLDALVRLETATRADQAKAMDAIDELLDVRQRARFRLLEQQLELRKLELVNRARQRQRANRP